MKRLFSLTPFGGSLPPDRFVLDREALQARGRTCWPRFDEESPIQIELPDESSEVLNAFSDIAGAIFPCMPFVSEIGEAHLFGEAPVVVTADRRFVLESTENSHSLLRSRLMELSIPELMGIIKMWFPTGKRIPQHQFDHVFPLVRHPTTNYYHWILGYLPKLRLYEWYAAEVDSEVRLLLSTNLTAWEAESLELAGVDIGTAEEWSGGIASASKVAIPFHRDKYSSTFHPSRADYAWVRERLRSNVSMDGTYPERVYISRFDASSRRVLNEEAVTDRLFEMGFQRFKLTELSLVDQIRLFTNAEIVVGPHGAGLTNVVFSDDLTIVEIHPEPQIRPHYYILAETLDFEYGSIVAPAYTSDNDMIVNVDRLENTIIELL